MSSFSLIADLKTELGECPLWSLAEQVLYLVDIKRASIHRYSPADGSLETYQAPEEIGCIGLARGGGFIAGMRSGLWLLERDGRPVRRLALNPEDQSKSRFNDGIVDPAGRFIAGTVDETRRDGIASLYRYDRRGLAKLAEGLLTSNGTAFSPDGRTLYHSDTLRYTVFAYDYDVTAGATARKRIFAKFKPTETDKGRPDGAAVDSEGCYWSALYEGGRVQKYAPNGTLLTEYPVPVRCPTMVAFGDHDLKTLYLTSARAGRPADELEKYPLSGGLFAMRVDVPGLARPLFDLDV